MPPVRVFISSTYNDLLDHRQAVSEAIRGLDLQADDMALWPADGRTTPLYSVDRVRQADVLVLLMAHRYGTIPDGAQHSVTELEYLAAREAGIPVLAFFVDEEIPWPPQHIDWDSRERLREFKTRVARESTRKRFRTPQELAVQVTQALANLLSRPADTGSARRFVGPVRIVSTVSRLLADPDVLVAIGTSEDGLPLLLDVTRSKDLSQPFQQLRDAVSSTDRPAPEEMLETFRASLVDYATRSWAGQDLQTVHLRNGADRLMYVTPFTLSGPFTSILSGFLSSTAVDISTPAITAAEPIRQGQNRPWDVAYSGQTRSAPNSLQSTGGRNRFLAIDPQSGATYSVGWSYDELVEWRPFQCEHVLPALPDTLLTLALDFDTRTSPVTSAADFLMTALSGRMSASDGRFAVTTKLSAERQALMLLIGEVADRLSELHARGIVHGDVKPDNVLVAESGVMLIDSFEVKAGDRSPGWTPNWSAPEQVRGEAVTPVADIYPLAVMAVKILGGEIVGEVRKYRTPRALRTPPEVDLFHSPSLYIDPDHSPISRRALDAWRDLIERSLSFSPERRPGSVAEFAQELRELVKGHRLEGRLTMRPTGDLVATRLVDGSEAVARVVSGATRFSRPRVESSYYGTQPVWRLHGN